MSAATCGVVFSHVLPDVASLIRATAFTEHAVSRHHIQPPVVYMPPPPKPKETKRKRGVGYVPGKGKVDETGETEETGDVSATRNAPPLPQYVPVEAAERKIPSPNGKLSDDTLKAMLQVQEEEGGSSTK
jgi:hypothetical protein